MKTKTRLMNFRLESNLYDELVSIARATEIPASLIARKGLKMILEEMKAQRPIWTGCLQGVQA
jgi:hypothetical protein